MTKKHHKLVLGSLLFLSSLLSSYGFEVPVHEAITEAAGAPTAFYIDFADGNRV